MRLLVFEEVENCITVEVIESVVEHWAFLSKLLKDFDVLWHIQTLLTFEKTDIVNQRTTQPVLKVVRQLRIHRRQIDQHLIKRLNILLVCYYQNLKLILFFWRAGFLHYPFGKRVNHAPFQHVLGKFFVKLLEEIVKLSWFDIINNGVHQFKMLNDVWIFLLFEGIERFVQNIKVLFRFCPAVESRVLDGSQGLMAILEFFCAIFGRRGDDLFSH